MKPLSFKHHSYAAHVIRYAVWLYFRFSLGLRDLEELLGRHGINVSYETIRCWIKKFGLIARRLKKRRPTAATLQISGLIPTFPHHSAEIYNTFYIERHLVSRPILRRFHAGAEAAWTVPAA